MGRHRVLADGPRTAAPAAAAARTRSATATTARDHTGIGPAPVAADARPKSGTHRVRRPHEVADFLRQYETAERHAVGNELMRLGIAYLKTQLAVSEQQQTSRHLAKESPSSRHHRHGRNDDADDAYGYGGRHAGPKKDLTATRHARYGMPVHAAVDTSMDRTSHHTTATNTSAAVRTYHASNADTSRDVPATLADTPESTPPQRPAKRPPPEAWFCPFEGEATGRIPAAAPRQQQPSQVKRSSSAAERAPRIVVERVSSKSRSRSSDGQRHSGSKSGKPKYTEAARTGTWVPADETAAPRSEHKPHTHSKGSPRSGSGKKSGGGGSTSRRSPRAAAGPVESSTSSESAMVQRAHSSHRRAARARRRSVDRNAGSGSSDRRAGHPTTLDAYVAAQALPRSAHQQDTPSPPPSRPLDAPPSVGYKTSTTTGTNTLQTTPTVPTAGPRQDTGTTATGSAAWDSCPSGGLLSPTQRTPADQHTPAERTGALALGPSASDEVTPSGAPQQFGVLDSDSPKAFSPPRHRDGDSDEADVRKTDTMPPGLMSPNSFSAGRRGTKPFSVLNDDSSPSNARFADVRPPAAAALAPSPQSATPPSGPSMPSFSNSRAASPGGIAHLPPASSGDRLSSSPAHGAGDSLSTIQVRSDPTTPPPGPMNLLPGLNRVFCDAGLRPVVAQLVDATASSSSQQSQAHSIAFRSVQTVASSPADLDSRSQPRSPDLRDLDRRVESLIAETGGRRMSRDEVAKRLRVAHDSPLLATGVLMQTYRNALLNYHTRSPWDA